MPEVRDCGRVVGIDVSDVRDVDVDVSDVDVSEFVDIDLSDVDIDVCDIGVDDVSDVDVDIDVWCVDVCGFVVGICGGGFVVGLSYHNRVSTTHYRFFIIATPHSQYLRH